jgi:hypothetical protein
MPDLPLDQRPRTGGALLRHRSLPARAGCSGLGDLRLAADRRWRCRRAALRCRPRRRGHARQLRPPQPHPPGEPRAPDAAPAGTRYRVRLRLNDVAQKPSRQAPHPPRGLDHLLADRLAGARAGRTRSTPAPAPSLSRCGRPDPADAALPPLPPSRTAPRSRSRRTSRRAPASSTTTSRPAGDARLDPGQRPPPVRRHRPHGARLTADRFRSDPGSPVRLRGDRLDGPARPRKLASGDADSDTARQPGTPSSSSRLPRRSRGTLVHEQRWERSIPRSGLMDGRPRRRASPRGASPRASGLQAPRTRL